MTIRRSIPTTATAPARDAVSARTRYQHVLNALSTLCGPPPLFETDIAPHCHRDPELSAAYLHALLAAIKRALAGKIALCRCCAGSVYCVHAALHDGGGPATDARVVGVVGDIIGLVVQSLAPTSAFAALLFLPFLEGKIDCLAVFWRARYIPTPSERNLLVLFEAGISVGEFPLMSTTLTLISVPLSR
ncbi:hypothetical protein B0H13DRAFT_2022152 [Mycena leptocephala]|nr:hypothetical protein B0H13DRAFT_2022152 [Mycena leptocephala]